MVFPIEDTSEDGLFRYFPLTRDYLLGTIKLIQDVYFKQEHLSIALGLFRKPEAVEELMETLVLDIIKQGISFIAVDVLENKVVGCLINILITKDDQNKSFYERYQFRHSLANTYAHISAQFDNAIDVFGLTDTRCYIEPMIGAVLPELRKSGIMYGLCYQTRKLFESLVRREDVVVSLDGKIGGLPEEHPVPGIVVVYSTTSATRKCVEKVGLMKICDVDMTKLTYRRELGLDDTVVEVMVLRAM